MNPEEQALRRRGLRGGWKRRSGGVVPLRAVGCRRMRPRLLGWQAQQRGERRRRHAAPRPRPDPRLISAHTTKSDSSHERCEASVPISSSTSSGRCRAHDTGRDQRRPAVDVWGHRCEAGNGSAVFGDGDLLTRFDPIEITAQPVLQLANADGDSNPISSSTRANIAAQSVCGAPRDCHSLGSGRPVPAVSARWRERRGWRVTGSRVCVGVVR